MLQFELGNIGVGRVSERVSVGPLAESLLGNALASPTAAEELCSIIPSGGEATERAKEMSGKGECSSAPIVCPEFRTGGRRENLLLRR